MGKPPVVVAAEVNVKHINACFNKVFHIFKGHFYCAALAEFFKRRNLVHSLAVCFVKSKREVYTIHNGEVFIRALADFLNHIYTEILPVCKVTETAAVKCRVGHLLNEIALMAVKINAVKVHCLCVGSSLTDVAYDFFAFNIRHSQARKLRHIPARVKRSGLRELEAVDKALGVADSAEACRELNENS